jgi:diketogulonate reductase-like aldo/keto reductase
LEKPFANEIQINPYVYCLEKDTLDLCFQNSIQLIAYSPLGFNTSQYIGMLSMAGEIGITTAQLTLAWLLSKRICVIPKSNNIFCQIENFRSKDAIYSVLTFSADMDKISEGAYLLDTANEEVANRLIRLVGLDW